MDRPSALAPKGDNQVPERPGGNGPKSPHSEEDRGRAIPDFFKKLVQNHRMETSVPQALFWMQLRPQSRGRQLESPCAEEALAG